MSYYHNVVDNLLDSIGWTSYNLLLVEMFCFWSILIENIFIFDS